MSSLKLYSLTKIARNVGDLSHKVFSIPVYGRRDALQPARRCYSAEQSERKSEKEPAPPGDLPPTTEECHARITALSKEVDKLSELVKDYEDKYRRALADGENIRRRMTKQVEDAKAFAVQGFCKDLLEVADTLATATESVPEQELAGASAALRSLHDGVRLTSAQLSQVFTRHGLTRVHPLHQKFDPNLHEALFTQEVEGAEPGTVVTVSKVGYKLHERCVRPALVGVAKTL